MLYHLSYLGFYFYSTIVFCISSTHLLKKSKEFVMRWILFIQKLNQVLVERGLAIESQSMLIAVSGGQDSACLFQAIRILCPFWKWNLAIVSCDHAWFDRKSKSCSQISQLAWYSRIKYYQSITPRRVIGEAKARSWRYESFA